MSIPFPRPLPIRPHSIRARMTLAFTGFIAILMLLLGLSFFSYLERQERKHFDMVLAQAMRELNEELEGKDLTAGNISNLVRVESGDLRALDVALAVVDAKGNFIARSTPEMTVWPLGNGWHTNMRRFQGYTVAVALPWNPVRARLVDRVRALLLMGGFVVLLSAVGAWYLVGKTLSPLEGLARQATAASAESLDVQLQTPSSDAEMVGLVMTLNDLLARLSQTAQLQARFYASASHELRTPLHVLNLLHEVTLSRPRDAPEYAKVLAESHQQIQHLTRLVQDLLLLNQLDMNSSHPESVLVDLADICEGELSHLRALIQQKSLDVSSPLPPHCELTAPWTHITMLTRNLMENSIKYTRSGGRVEMEVSARHLRIWNQCEDASSFKLDKFFEPFYRPDDSRNSQTGGNGLGLSICQAICQTNGWGLVLTCENEGVCALVTFPAL